MVNGTKAIVAFSVLTLSLAQAQAQTQSQEDLQEALKAFLSSALQINISVRVLSSDETPVWNMESSKLTIPGRSVNVRLDGDNIRIFLICTPYVQENGTMLLLAQGQVWLSSPPDSSVKSVSTFYNIPVSLGEKVLFFPLGVPSEVAKKDYFNIELEIQIVPYVDPNAAPADPSDQEK
jgi:hypothetical protein